jgi:16S rRNA (cytosine967-C5)-methyltransferase
VPFVLKLRGPFDYANSRVFREGLIVPQDEASALASLLLGPRPGELVVDLCAAPGGKTTHIGELMENRGRIIAVELYEDRARRLKQLLERTGVRIAQVLVMDGKDSPLVLGEEVADRVLLDPPCTSTGAVVKSPEAKWRFSPERLSELVNEQRELMRAAVKLLKPGGYMLYTTCSILREENEDNVNWLLEKYRDCVELVKLRYPGLSEGLIPGTLRTWPHKHGTSGFFYSLIRKVKSCRD